MVASKVAIQTPKEKAVSAPKNLNHEGASSRDGPSANSGLILQVRQTSPGWPRTQAPKAKPQSPTLRNDLIPTPEHFGMVSLLSQDL